jgi:hypothetical protein
MDKSNDPETLNTLARATALSLDCVRSRVAKENPDWTTTRVDTAVAEYRKWLVLIALKKFDKLGMCSTDVDEVWHAHILFTRKYAADCEALCGPDASSTINQIRRRRSVMTQAQKILCQPFNKSLEVSILSGTRSAAKHV